MPSRADDYEAFIEEIFSNVRAAKQRNIDELDGGRKNRLRGKSGQLHQVDVSFVDKSFSEDTLVLIECKLYKKDKKVSVDVAKIMAYNACDIIGNDKYPKKAYKIILSTSGFQKGVQRIAEYEDIKLLVVNDGPPFGFDYEDIIFTGNVEHISTEERVKVKLGPMSED